MVTADNFFYMVNRKVHEMTDEIVVKRSNKSAGKIDRAAIQKECEEVYFKELGKELEKELKNFNVFYDFLSHDNHEVFNKIKGIVTSKLNHSNVESVDDLLKVSTQKPDEKLINELKQIALNAFNKEDFNKAFYYFSYLALVESNNSQFWLLKAMSAHNLNRMDEALKAYDYSIALDPQNLLAHIHRLNGLIKAHQLEKGRHCLEEFVRNFDHQDYDNNPFFVSSLERIKKSLGH